MENREIEVRFIEIDKNFLLAKLKEVGAIDNGEELIKEIIFYDKEMKWPKEWKFVRLRQDKKGNKLTFKKVEEFSIDGTIEVEIVVDDWNKAVELVKTIGLIDYRQQEKKRHSFLLDGVEVDLIDWPLVPTLVELEGKDEQSLRLVADKIGLDWTEVELRDNRWLMENKYKIPFTSLRFYTFTKIE
ncbi:CYTH domain-containing protein [Patescibacteria group bacterium]|nr:CYTH domain-containing protein [Patescibacteria group bacterium]